MTNRKGLLKGLGIISLILLCVGCSNGSSSQSSTATIKVKGTAGTNFSGSSKGSKAFASGTVLINNVDITSTLKPTTNTAAGQNNVEFRTEVEVETPTIELSVSGEAGYVFDEWEIDKASAKADLKKGHITMTEYRKLKLTDAEEKAETISVDAKLASYYIATFDHGYYVDFTSTASENDGSKEKPFTSISALVSAHPNASASEDDELTIKIANSSSTDSLDLTGLAGYEEVSVVGGFDSNWKIIGKSEFSSFAVSSGIEELEIENLSFSSLDIDSLSGEAEINMENCQVINLLAAANAIIGNLIVTGSVPSNTILVNCVAPFDATNTYYHSLLKNVPEGASIEGKNNLLTGTVTTPIDDNLIISVSDVENTYKVKSSVTGISEAYSIDYTSLDERLEDFLEEDIEGRDRPEAEDGTPQHVSFGPYEYLED